MQVRQQRQRSTASFQPMDEQQVGSFQFYGWHGLMITDFPEFYPELEEILFEEARGVIALLHSAEYGTLLVFLMRSDNTPVDFPQEVFAQAVLFSADPLERRTGSVTASDTWGAFEQVFAYFSLPDLTGENELCGPPTSTIQEGIFLGNVGYRVPDWVGCTVFFPTREDRSIIALMISSGEGAQYSARIVRFSPDTPCCNQAEMHAPSPEGIITRALYRYRIGTIARYLLHCALRWRVPPWLTKPLRWVGGAIGILLAFLFQMLSIVVILGTLGEIAPAPTGISAALFPFLGLLGTSIVLLPVFCPRLATSPPSHWRNRLHGWLIGALLSAEWGTFLYAALVSGSFWDASFLIEAGFFLWLTFSPVYAGREIGRMFHGRKSRFSGVEERG